jgi:predicted RNA-binding protein YlxR (DUF448 family)
VLQAETSPPSDPGEAAGGDERGPYRRCLVTGESMPVERAIRFVVGPDDSVVPDIEARLPGRGMWLSADRDVVNKALAKHQFARAARRTVAAPGDLADRIESLLARRCVDLIGLARRAGQVVAGFDQVRAALPQSGGGVLIEASDGSDDGRDKLLAIAPAMAVVDTLSSTELGAALGRDRFVHVLIAPGRLADKIRIEASRLAGFRTAKAAGSDRTPLTKDGNG